MKKAKQSHKGDVKAVSRDDPELSALPYELDLSDEGAKWVGRPGASQQKGVPDIHYLWGQGRMINQRMMVASAFFVCIAVLLNVLTPFWFNLVLSGELFFPHGWFDTHWMKMMHFDRLFSG